MPIWAVLLVIAIAIAGTATALSINLLTTPKITINSANPSSSTVFVVQDNVAVKVLGRNTVNLTIAVQNPSATAATGTIEVQLLDSTNNVISGMDQKLSITNLAAGGTWTREFSFTTTDLVDAFSTYFIILTQP
jgi:hypothetical protein